MPDRKDKILVVDDDPAALLFASSVIRKAGYEVFEAETGDQALEQAREHVPDLILLDVMLPDISGIEVCRIVKSDPDLKGTIILLFSAIQTEPGDKALGLETGADGYLVKPIQHKELTAQIRAMLRIKQAEERILLQKQWYEAVLNSLLEVVLCMDTDLKVIWANKSALESIQIPLEKAIGTKCSLLWNCDSKSREDCPVAKTIISGNMEQALIRTRDGKIWDTRAYPVKDESDRIINLVEVAMDVTHSIKTSNALQKSENLLKEVMTRVPGAVIQYEVVNNNIPRIAFVSHGVKSLLGLSPANIADHPEIIWSRVHPQDCERVQAQFAKRLKDKRPFGSDFRVIIDDDKVKWVRISSVPHIIEESTSWYAVLTDITPLKTVEEELTRKALHDPLTGLPNRHLFNDRLEQAISYAERYRQKVGLIFIDLDNFKPINDELGHMFGDSVLQTVARRIEGCARKTDTVARFGGEEFVLLLPSITDKADVKNILSRIVNAINKSFDIDGRTARIDASIGISVYPQDAHDMASMVSTADKAMYEAKNKQGTSYCFYDEIKDGN